MRIGDGKNLLRDLFQFEVIQEEILVYFLRVFWGYEIFFIVY